MLQALALAGLSAGGSLLSSIGAGQASAKQGRLQMIEDNMNRLRNDEKLAGINLERVKLGRELLTVPQKTYQAVAQSTTSSTRGDVDIDAMMAAAEKAGFNPETFLNAGALQYYARSWADSFVNTQQWDESEGHNAAEAFKMMLPEYALSTPSQVPQQHSMLSALGGALTAGTNAFGTQLRADQSYDLQLARLLAGNSLQGMGLGNGNGFAQVIQPRTNQIGIQPRAGLSGAAGGGGGESKLSDAPYPQNWKPGDIDVSNPYQNLWIDSRAPNAEMKSDRYGDVWEELFGTANMVQDIYRNVAGETTYDTGKRLGINIGSFRQPGDTSLSPAFGRWWNDPSSLPTRVQLWANNVPAVNGPRAPAWLPSNPFSGYIGY